MDEKIYWLGFSLFSGIGPIRFRTLLAHFGSAEAAWHADATDFKKGGLGPKLTEQFLDFRKKNELEEYLEKLDKAHVSFITAAEERYPKRLLAIKNPPLVLYIKGHVVFNTPESDLAIAVVGTRKITDYGTQITEMLTTELSLAGCVIVSGLALGVDAVAHASAVAAGGKTIAVLGCGVDCCTPRENELIYQDILSHGGAIVSEYPLSQQATIGSFPSRNRIIAGLSAGVLVTEGAEDSGSLITANKAIEMNRKVFAVPGPITSSVSKGPITLISKGAKIVTTAQDILDELNLQNKVKRRQITGDTKEEQTVIDLLGDQNLHFDDLVKRTGLDSSHVGTLLSLMEMKGIVQSFPGGVFGLA